MLKIYPQSKVYIACPAAIATGGPELLNQLCYNLRNSLGIKAYMYYYPSSTLSPVHPDYKSYDNPYTNEIEDIKENVLIVPEIGSALSLLEGFHNIRKVVWFLGLDGYFLSKLKKTNFLLQGKRGINKVLKLLGKYPLFEVGFENINIEKFPPEEDPLLQEADLIMTNSYRGIDFLKSRGFSPVYLSEYLNEDFLRSQTDLSKKENIIAYNPSKGFSFTKKIIKLIPDFKFVPLINMSRKEVIKTLQKAKVYIDFGNHSGKDRIPREGAILFCCVITGKRGSAAFYEDVAISSEYKFSNNEDNIPLIVSKIRECLHNYERELKNFDYYREKIKEEPQKFISDLKNIFEKAE